MHKTGSTAIQYHLRQQLHLGSWNYLCLDNNPNQSLAAFTLFSSHPETHNLHLQIGRTHQQVLDIQRSLMTLLQTELSRHDERNLIFSGEGIIFLTAEELAELNRVFRSGGIERIDVFAYVRTPKSFMESAFQERLKNYSAIQPGQWELNALYPNYRQRFLKFIEVFGDDRVHFRRFDSKRFSEHCVVRDFCEFWQIPFAGPVRRINDGLSRPALAALYTFRQFGKMIPQGPLASQINGLLLNRIADLPGPRIRFSPNSVAPVLKAHQDDIAWMEAQMDESLDEDLSPTQYDIQDFDDLLRFDSQAVADLMGLMVECITSGLTVQQAQQEVHQVVVPKLPPVKFSL
jgi:hypothetical protein